MRPAPAEADKGCRSRWSRRGDRAYPAPMAMRRLTDLPAGALARALFAAVPDGILVLDADGVVLDASDALCDAARLHPRRDRRAGRRRTPGGSSRRSPAAARRFAAGRVREGAAVLVRRDGTTMPATVRSVAARGGRRGRGRGGGGAAPRWPRGLPAGDDDHRAVVAAIHEGVRRARPGRRDRARATPAPSGILRAPGDGDRRARPGRTGGRCARTARPIGAGRATPPPSPPRPGAPRPTP